MTFKAQLIDKQLVTLNWATSSERDADYFSIEKSNDGVHFNSIGQVKAAGNSTKQTDYSFNDNSITTDKIMYYRLQQMDINKTFKYSKTIAIYNDKNKNKALKVYPNPAKNTLIIDNETAIKSIAIYNLQGKLMTTAYVNTIDISNYSAGMYLLEVHNTEGGISRIKFIKE